MTKTVLLDDETRSVLMRSRIDGNNLHLPGQLERADYMRVAKAIEAPLGTITAQSPLLAIATKPFHWLSLGQQRNMG